MKSLFSTLEFRFGLAAAALFLVVALAGQHFMLKQERAALEVRMGEKATFIHAFYAKTIAEALQRKDDVALLNDVTPLEHDKEVMAVVVVDNTGEVRYHQDPEQVGTILNDPLVASALKSGDGVLLQNKVQGHRALTLVSPLKVVGRAEPIGAVRVDMTYRPLEQLLERFETSLRLVVLGLALSCVSVIVSLLRSWILFPLGYLKRAINRLTPANLEPNLPETPDEFGQVNTALNELILRVKSELQASVADRLTQADQEKLWVEKLAHSLLTEQRVIIADKDNLVLSDTGNPAAAEAENRAHLLDLVTDAQFSNLVAEAFQKEGEVKKGPVTFQEKPYHAAVLRMPSQYATFVKTVIALNPA